MFNIKNPLKKMLSCGLWSMMRKRLIIIKHQRVVHKLHYIVDNTLSGKYRISPPLRKVNLPENGKIIWQYWAQGYDSNSMPELVRICLDSVEKIRAIIC